MMFAAMAMVFGMASCSDDDDDKVVDVAQTVSGLYQGQTVADFAYAKGYKTEGEVDSVTVTKVSNTAVNINYKSGTWGTADFNNVAVTENDTAYVFTSNAASKINMPDMHKGGVVNSYDASLESGYVLKNGNRSKFQVKLNIPAVMGGLTLTFSPNT